MKNPNTTWLALSAVALVGVFALAGCAACETGPVAQAQAVEPCGVSAPTTVSSYLPGDSKRCAVVLLEKTAPQQVIVGQPFDYELKVTNVSGVTLHDVTVHESDLSGVQVSQFDPEPTSKSGDSYTWNVGSLDAGQSQVIHVTATPKADGQMNTCAQVTYRPNSVCMNITAVQSALALQQIAPSEKLICDAIPLRFVVTNTGTGKACNVVVNSELPDGWQTLDGKDTLMFTAGTLDAGQSREFEARIKADKTGQFTNTAVATADGGLRTTAAASTTVVEPKLSATISSPDTRYAGTEIPYTITVVNGPEVQASDVVLTSTLPAGAQFVSASDDGQLSGNQVVWNLGNMAPRDTRKVQVTLKSSQVGQVQQSASVVASCGTAQAQASTTVRGIPAILLEVVDLNDPVKVGENTTYRITVTNQGSAVDNNIRIVATLPGEQSFVSGSGATQVASQQGKTVTFAPLASLAPGAKATWEVVVKADAAADSRFETEMSSDMLGKTPVRETEATHLYE